jgi:hypothetical protein
MDTAWLLYNIKGLCIDSIQANPSNEAERYLHKRRRRVHLLSGSCSPPCLARSNARSDNAHKSIGLHSDPNSIILCRMFSC